MNKLNNCYTTSDGAYGIGYWFGDLVRKNFYKSDLLKNYYTQKNQTWIKIDNLSQKGLSIIHEIFGLTFSLTKEISEGVFRIISPRSPIKYMKNLFGQTRIIPLVFIIYIISHFGSYILGPSFSPKYAYSHALWKTHKSRIGGNIVSWGL